MTQYCLFFTWVLSKYQFYRTAQYTTEAEMQHSIFYGVNSKTNLVIQVQQTHICQILLTNLSKAVSVSTQYLTNLHLINTFQKLNLRFFIQLFLQILILDLVCSFFPKQHPCSKYCDYSTHLCQYIFYSGASFCSMRNTCI